MSKKKRPVKIIIQIPCYNEEKTLGITLSQLPRRLPGADVVEWLVINDGSTDRTAEVAREHGVDYILNHPTNKGLAQAFMTGLQGCLDQNADIIVNTDADIPKLIAPILEGKADIVVGNRPITMIQHFSPVKKLLQRLGSSVVRRVSGAHVMDAPSGFRAISRDAAMRLNVFTEYTYTLETIIQAGMKGISITSVDIRTNDELRSSHLVRGLSHYVLRSCWTIIRIFMAYRPFSFFAIPGLVCLGLGFLLGLRFLIYRGLGDSAGGHVQSVILCALLLGAGFFLVVVGLLSDLISVNRKLLEKIDWRIQHLEDKHSRSESGNARMTSQGKCDLEG